MIVTLTANPSHDRTVNLAAPLERGTVQRAESVISQAGGKGVNISRACVAADQPTIAVLPATKDDPFVLELLAAGIDCRPVPHEGDLRVNITITEPDGTTTKLNSPGPQATARLLDELTEALVRRAATAEWIVLAGSLPPGAPPEWYAELVTALRTAGARVAVDTSDAPLKALVDALPTSAPHLMKPNGEELASFTGHQADELEHDPRAAAAAADDLIARGVESVLVTLGPHGAVLVNDAGAWHATPPPTTVVSTVGAGDSSLFGYLLGDVTGRDPRPTTRTGRGLRKCGRGTPRHDHPPPPAGSARARPGDPPRPHPRRVTMTDLITTDLVRLDADLGADKHEVIRALARVVADAGRSTDAGPARRGRHHSRRHRAHRAARWHRDPPLPHHGGRRSRPWPSPASLRRSSSVPRTARPTSPS